jgi:hypothetical protein
VACWLRNRWHWREKRRVRADVAGWERLAVPLDRLDLDTLDPGTRRMAVLVERLRYSGVLHLGYGMGEAIVVAATNEPDRMRPFIESACQFSDGQFLGADRFPEGVAAVAARNALLLEVRQIVSRYPKQPSTA